MTAPAKRPNILFLLSDRHQFGVAGFAGDPVVDTAHLDRVAARGVHFDAAYCTAPLCTPSRMSMMTGKEPHNCSAWSNHWVIFPEHVTWPGHFAAHGYRTCLVGKMHFGGKNQMNGFELRPYGDLRHGLGHQGEPIDMFPGYPQALGAGPTQIPESLLQDVVVTREAMSFVLNHAAANPDQPWFLCASFGRPHPPYTAPDRYIRKYQGKSPVLDRPDDFLDKLDPYCRKLADAEPDTQVSDEQMRTTRDAFYASVDFLDDCIGELLDALDKAGELENTIVIYTTDHGEMMGTHGMWGLKNYFDECARVPLVMAGPGVAPRGNGIAAPMSLMDLFPTTCGLAGLPVPQGLDGVDFSSVLGDANSAAMPRACAVCSYYAYGVRVKGSPSAAMDQPLNAMRMVRDARYKYVEVEGGSPLLFDMQNDPGETANLADDANHAAVCQRLRDLLFNNFSWQAVHERIVADRERIPAFFSGLRPSTPNQYMLPDGRVFDAEGDLYGARWLQIPPGSNGGIIPQQLG